MKMISSMNPRSIRFVTFNSAIGCVWRLVRKVRAIGRCSLFPRFLSC